MASKKRGRPAKSDEDGLHPLTILIPLKVRDELKAESEAKGRPVSEIVRQRLAGHTEPAGTIWALNESLRPRARAIGQLVAYVADELMREKANVKSGLSRLVDGVIPDSEVDESGESGAMIADYWRLRIKNAHEPTYENGSPKLLAAGQQALLEIRNALSPVAPKKTVANSRNRKEKN